mmetsp:Transcript_7949/g.20014  ORF Transcript_7949/g.20014 Transcript_7949/m.20014 type:complete len:236 (-) Transcript_7949:2022-2729(-)
MNARTSSSMSTISGRCGRCSGSLAQHFCTTDANFLQPLAGRGGLSPASSARRISIWDTSSQGDCPVKISHSTTPNEYTSDCLVYGFSRESISGGSQFRVPSMELLALTSLKRTLEEPKSVIFMERFLSRSRLGDFKSRCRTGGDRECKYFSPNATSAAHFSCWGHVSKAVRVRRILSSEPFSAYSRAMNTALWAFWVTPTRLMMLVCDSPLITVTSDSHCSLCSFSCLKATTFSR